MTQTWRGIIKRTEKASQVLDDEFKKKTAPVIRQNDFSGYSVDGVRNIYSGHHGIGPCTHDHKKQSEKSDGNSSNNN